MTSHAVIFNTVVLLLVIIPQILRRKILFFPNMWVMIGFLITQHYVKIYRYFFFFAANFRFHVIFKFDEKNCDHFNTNNTLKKKYDKTYLF